MAKVRGVSQPPSAEKHTPSCLRVTRLVRIPCRSDNMDCQRAPSREGWQPQRRSDDASQQSSARHLQRSAWGADCLLGCGTCASTCARSRQERQQSAHGAAWRARPGKAAGAAREGGRRGCGKVDAHQEVQRIGEGQLSHRRRVAAAGFPAHTASAQAC
jgi:hypothetical protein